MLHSLTIDNLKFIDAQGNSRSGTFLLKSSSTYKQNSFFSIKADGSRLIENWVLIQSFPSISIFNIGVNPTLTQEHVITVTATQLIRVLAFLKSNTIFYYEQLRDISAIDHIKQHLRFEVVYQLLSISNTKRLSLTVFCSEGASLFSATDVYSSAGWYEREVWDRFGVFFTNHPDLRRILTDYGFKGHPLRKDFPVTGFVEVRYNTDTKSIAYEKVNLAQASREAVNLPIFKSFSSSG